MANPNIKFFRCNPWPSTITPQEGYVWFNTTDRTISLYKNGEWEKYTGKINNVTYVDGVLTIIPHEGEPIPINLGNVANIEGLSSRLGTLETNLNTLSGEFTTEKGKITTLQGEMATVKTEVAKLEGITDKVTTYVVTKIGEEEKIRKAADDAFEGRISGLETTTGQHTESINSLKGLVGETAVATQITNAINALDNNGVTGTGSYVDVTVTQVDGKVTTVAVVDGDLTAAFNDVNKTISDETTRATTKEGELAGAIDTQKGRIDALVGADAPAEGETQMSVREIVQDEVALQLESENISDSFDTLKEMAEWLSSHPEDVAEMNDAIGKNTTGVATNAADIVTIKSDIETINTTIEENELTVASALTDLDVRLTSLASSTISSVSGEDYISATTSEGAVVVRATTGAVANGDNALALASDVKGYVDSAVNSAWTWGEF